MVFLVSRQRCLDSFHPRVLIVKTVVPCMSNVVALHVSRRLKRVSASSAHKPYKQQQHTFICVRNNNPVVDMSVHGDHGSGAAKRRRDRRLRMHWRHELTLQMALAAAAHHSRDVGPVSYNALRSQRTARAGEWGREQNYTAETWDPPTPQPELFSLSEEEPNGARPGSVTDPVPQVRVERHVVEHRIEACPFVQILDAPVPQGGNQLVEAFRHLDLHIPEQVIEVPKISSSRRRCRRRQVPVVQTAEQLVEVPEFVSFAFLFQQQIADAPGRSSWWRRSSRCTPRTEFSSVLWSRTR